MRKLILTLSYCIIVSFSTEHLVLLRPSVTATGTVEYIAKEKDGDYHLRLRLDSQAYLLNRGNVLHQHGCLLLEIVPSHPLPRPHKGDHISCTGAWVRDKHHGWNEIHPVNNINIIH